ncbi:Extracellular metalloproteinase 4 [Rhizoctonia solani]|uniref:Extracellular metalloproteinase n=1 Tax=Rhizoctonia solani TaxID=456999 RepID=A0A0K6FMH7_9AGAM|nr:Extracellular metalloproteinase 4 [Rhizoctonia solani]
MRLSHRIVALSFAFVASSNPNPIRKSLRFGLRPPTRYVTEPHINSTLTSSAHTDPLDVARAFIQLYTDSDFYIRDDSYTDENTGISHVYARQLFQGLETADGNINLNICDGNVLSFGDSFFQGPASPLVNSPWITHATYCAELTTRSLALDNVAQIMLSDKPRARDRENWYTLHCTRPLVSVRQAAATDFHKDLNDPRRVALYFMITAHPEPLVVEKLAHDFSTTIDRMTVTYDQLSPARRAQRFAIISDLPGTVSPVKVHKAYIQIPTANGTVLHATWRLEVEMAHNWYEAYVSFYDPTAIISAIDWASDSSTHSHGDFFDTLEAEISMHRPGRYTKAGTYKVWKWGVNDPQSGERTTEPASYDLLASPLGWHTIPRTSNPIGSPEWIGKGVKDHNTQYLNFTTTWGNNVFAQENWKGYKEQWISNYRPEGGRTLAFNFEYDAADGSNNNHTSYVDLSVTQLFYTSNMVHDLYYRYGFNERAGNFQQDNFRRGGRGNDSIIATTQDGSGSNNAYFMAPPDGQHGRCRMFIWNTMVPYRDGSLDAGIVIHELSHGLSSRLTGGPDNAGCLPWGESAGMGEGWGDFLATTIRSTKDHQDYAIGGWASNQINGVRRYLYSKNTTVNPLTYSSLDDPEAWTVHSMGEVWAEILRVVMQGMIEKHGYSPTLFPPAPLENGTIPTSDFYWAESRRGQLVPKHGNTLMLQLVITGMKLQPCRPSFFDARDAIILADKTLTGGENFCNLWHGFSSRGLGKDAKFVPDHSPWNGGEHIDGFAVPAECE